MKLKFIGCQIFESEIEQLARESENDIVIQWLPQGLHAAPDTLRHDLQQAIDATAPGEGYDAILVGYGLCCRGIEGISSRNLPLVIPRLHDCIGAFLGSNQRYLEEFHRHPGTYWFSRGFINLGGQPGVKGKYRGVFARYEKLYEDYRQRYGEQLALYLLEEWDQRWIRNYTRAAHLHWNYPEAQAHRQLTEQCAKNLGWTFEQIETDFSLLRRLLAGQWNPDEVLVVLPGRQVVAVQDERIIDAVSPEEIALMEAGAVREENLTMVVDENGQMAAVPLEALAPAGSGDDIGHLHAGLGLGIDAGGTYTDLVLYDFATRAVLASSKGLTTPHEPALGVADALSRLPAERFGEIRLVSLATTFATNAIVENKGRAVGLILAGFDDYQLERIAHRPRRAIAGSYDVNGHETEPLDEAAARRAIRELTEIEGAEALAIVGFGGARNPAHEVRLRDLAASMCDLPVVCGHELSSELNCRRRATTAALNARISPLVVKLVRSVESVLAQQNIQAHLVMVRADGSLMDSSQACHRPVEMILSGPAASLCGAFALTQLNDAVVVDIGGTTSDIALLKGGRPVYGTTGAVVGGHSTTVRAPDVHTSGQGGDSHIRVDTSGNVTVGPRRALPLCYLASRHDRVMQRIASMARKDLAELKLMQPAEMFLLVREPAGDGRFLTDQQRRIVDALRSGPRTIVELADALNYPYYSCLGVNELEETGIVIRAGLTPTDLLHVEGSFTPWDVQAARLATELVAQRAGLSLDDLIARVRFEIRRHLMESVLSASLGLDVSQAKRDPLSARLLASAVGGGDSGDVVGCQLTLAVPIIGIGAPAEAFIPEVARALSTRCEVPELAGVAGAVGAVTGSVVEHVTILIRPCDTGGFTLHAPDEARGFAKLGDAKRFARDHAVELVRKRAQAAGAARFMVRVHVEDRQARADTGFVYIETRVRAEATGAPQTR